MHWKQACDAAGNAVSDWYLTDVSYLTEAIQRDGARGGIELVHGGRKEDVRNG